jgi:hypothetical protein
MSTTENFQVSTLSELRRKGVLSVNCAGHPLVILYNGGRPCVVERSLTSYEQARNSLPESGYNLPPVPAHVPRYSLEIRDDELWIVVTPPRYVRLLTALRRLATNFGITLSGTARKISILRRRSSKHLAVLRHSSRKFYPQVFEGE